MLRPNGQVENSVKSYTEILQITLRAWQTLPTSLFQSAWIVCGYVSQDHFENLGGKCFQLSEAQGLLDPTGLFRSCGLRGTPERCQLYEWQVQELRVHFSAQHSPDLLQHFNNPSMLICII